MAKRSSGWQRAAWWLAAIASGCSATATPGGSADSGRVFEVGSDVSTDAGVISQDTGATPVAVVCTGTRVAVFPTFDRRCAAATECAAVLHQTDCCGTFVAMGLRASERGGFDAAEMRCQSMLPGCGCASRETTDDDGNPVQGSGVAMIDARCRDGRCVAIARGR